MSEEVCTIIQYLRILMPKMLIKSLSLIWFTCTIDAYILILGFHCLTSLPTFRAQLWAAVCHVLTQSARALRVVSDTRILLQFTHTHTQTRTHFPNTRNTSLRIAT